MIQRIAGITAWAVLVSVVGWAAYDWLVFVVLPFPIAMSIAVGSLIATRAALRGRSERLRPLNVASEVSAAVASLTSASYFVWWGFAFDAADAGENTEAQWIESALFGISAISILIVVFIAGAAWIVARGWADDPTRV